MKKIIVLSVIAMLAAGCSFFGADPETIHNEAVERLSAYAEASINKKIDNSANLSDEGKAKLKAQVAALVDEILARIAEIKAKCDAAKK